MKLLKSILTSTLLLCALFIGQAQAYGLNTQTGQIPTNSVTVVGTHTYVNAQYVKATNGTWWVD